MHLTLFADRTRFVQPIKVLHSGTPENWTCTVTYPRAAVRRMFRGYNLRDIIDAAFGEHHGGPGAQYCHRASARTRGPLLVVWQRGGLDI